MPWPLKLITIQWRCIWCKTPAADGKRCLCASDRGLEVVDSDRGLEVVDVVTGERPKVGDCFLRPDMVSGVKAAHLSPQYKTRHATTRPPITVVLPDKSGVFLWCVDKLAYDHKKGGYHGEGWLVTGELPKITCIPSINMVGRYHGYVRDGVITDDIEGRSFPEHSGDTPPQP